MDDCAFFNCEHCEVFFALVYVKFMSNGCSCTNDEMPVFFLDVCFVCELHDFDGKTVLRRTLIVLMCVQGWHSW